MLTTLNIIEILGILFIHWFADFPMQNTEEATNKSTSNEMLLKHTSKYIMIWLIVSLQYFLYFGLSTPHLNSKLFINIMLFNIITFILHTITDYYSSRITKNLFENKLFYQTLPKLGAFSVIGLHQFAHYAQLFITYIILLK
jgi:hypothetical protein